MLERQQEDIIHHITLERRSLSVLFFQSAELTTSYFQVGKKKERKREKQNIRYDFLATSNRKPNPAI